MTTKTPMPTLATIRLRCADPAAQSAFYREVLGMRARADGTVGYGEGQAGLLFEPARAPYAPAPRDLYWKIALSVPDLDLACRQLRARGVEVGTPHQVGDIAYLAHFRDPEGFTVELIDHWFQGDRPADARDTERLGGGPCLNLLTLRAAEIAPVEAAVAAMGMNRLSIVPAPTLGFDLHFYAFTDEVPPNPDPRAIENRTWVYRRPYTVLEIQHLKEAGGLARPEPGAGGYAGASVRGLPPGSQGARFGFEPVRQA